MHKKSWLISAGVVCVQIYFVLLISRQGKVRLTKWYSPHSQMEKIQGTLISSLSSYLFLLQSSSQKLHLTRVLKFDGTLLSANRLVLER